MIVTRRQGPQRTGRARTARLTDLAAVGELSRLSHVAGNGREPRDNPAMRTLGLPVGSSHISVFSLFRLPLGAFQPNDRLYVHEERGRLTGFARVERESLRDEWTIVELDAVDHGDAGDIRFRLVQYLLRDASKRGGIRFHVACADEGGNVELFMQAGFARYGEERILYRSPDGPSPALISASEAAGVGIRPAVPLDALRLDRLYRAVTPAPVSRLEDYRLHDWERQGSHWRVPRSSLTPILRFADVEGFVQEGGSDADGELAGFVQIGVAKDDEPHYLRVITRPEHDPSTLIRFGMAIIGDRARSGFADRAVRGQGTERGLVSAVRTYEAPLDRRFEEHGFSRVASVSLLMREMAERVAQPALAPAASR